MIYEPFISYLSSIVALKADFCEALKSELRYENYKPHQVFHAAGQVENRLWYVEKGFVRAYYFDRTGKEHTLNFYLEKGIIFSQNGFWQLPSDYYLETLEASCLTSLTYKALNYLMAHYLDAKTLGDLIIRYKHQQEEFKSRLMTWNADERYKQFRKVNSGVFKRASIRLIATYLNMTRENLSRLMGKDL
jgi:CRP-like cAMP-binding protein